MSTGLFFAEGADWGRIRRLTSPSFNFHNVDSMMAAITKDCKELIQGITANSALNGSEIFIESANNLMVNFTFKLFSTIAFGKSIDDENGTTTEDIGILLGWMFRRVTVPLPNWFWHHVWHDKVEKKAFEAIARFHARIEKFLASYKPSTAEFPMLISTLMSASLDDQSRKGLSRDELISQIFVFAIAGAETTSSLISSILYLLCREENRSILNALHEEIDSVLGTNRFVENVRDLEQLPLLDATFKEANRLRGPAVIMGFQTTGDSSEMLPGGIVVSPKVKCLAFALLQ